MICELYLNKTIRKKKNSCCCTGTRLGRGWWAAGWGRLAGRLVRELLKSSRQRRVAQPEVGPEEVLDTGQFGVGFDSEAKRFPSRGSFPGGSVVKNLPANDGNTGWIPGSGRSPGEGNGNPLQYSCQENPTD